MSDDNKPINFQLNLDSKEFVEEGLKAKEVIDRLGEAEGLTGLLEGLMKTSLALGAVGVAAYAFKEAIDLTLEAEQIQRIEKSFETLAENAGISSKELKEGMESAAGGLMDTTDLLKIANEALVKMGGSAERLPEIMEMARKATTVFGGDLSTNFENMTNAIANGNTRLLKHYGILVDAKKAVDDFAKANNIAVNEISEAGKRQAILNAALDQGKKAFAGVNEDVNSATTSMQMLKATFTDIGEAFVLAFDKTIGPGVRAFLHSMQSVASSTKLYMQSAFGDETTKAAANIALLEGRIKDTQKTIADLEKKKGTFLDLAPADTISRLQVLPAKLKELEAELAKLKVAEESLGDTEKKTGEARVAQSQEDIRNEEIHLQNKVKFEAELLKLNQATFISDMKNVQSFSDIEENALMQNELSEKAHAVKIEEIRRNKNLTLSQQEDLMNAEQIKHNIDLMHIEKDNDALRKTMMTNYVHNSTNALQGISRAFEANGKKMSMELKDFGLQGQEVWDSMRAQSTSAFETMGAEMAKGKDIAQAAADAMKSIFLNMIADYAIASGSRLLLEGVATLNPAEAAGGAALIALGGALRAAAGSGGSSSVSEKSASASPEKSPFGSDAFGNKSWGKQVDGIDNAYDSSSSTSDSQINMRQNQAAPQRNVTINIAGNYMETDATRRQLMEMLRQETDATGFTYNQIGV